MLSVKAFNKNHRIWLIIIASILVVCNVLVLLFSTRTSAPIPIVNVIVEPKPIAISSNILFTGNTYWGRYINDWSMASPLQYAYPFSRLNEFNRDSYDAWISGLECPTVAGVNLTSAEEDSTLAFNCSPNYLPEAAKWFTAFTLANNHTDNQGVDGFIETRQHLEENGIQYFGNYDPTVLGDACEVIALPVTVENDNSELEKGKLPVAICAYHGVFQIPPDESIAQISKYSPYMPVVAMPHMGVEYMLAPDQLKTSVYRSMIDAGADMVLGDHPHKIQTTESYNGHLIVYSMGNFLFDQQENSDVTQSAGIRVVMKTTNQDSGLLEKWLALGESCATFHDDCLDQAIEQKLVKLDINYQFAIIGTSDADKIVKPATEAQQTGILDRLQWQNTINNLQAPYSSL